MTDIITLVAFIDFVQSEILTSTDLVKVCRWLDIEFAIGTDSIT
jgi:hypothetical protein